MHIPRLSLCGKAWVDVTHVRDKMYQALPPPLIEGRTWGQGSLGTRPSKNQKGGSGKCGRVEVYTVEC